MPKNRSAPRALRLAALLGATATALSACATPAADTSETVVAEGLAIYATTGYLADAAHAIAPDAAITTMVGPGGDPHTYQPSTRDIQAILEADAVLWNGLELEAQMDELLEGQGERALAVGEVVPDELLIPVEGEGAAGLFDPHIWNSPEAWSIAIEAVADHLAALDPDRADDYAANASAYVAELEAVAAEAHELLADVPAPRILITGHDAFAYFGQTFDLDVHATDFISTEAALSARQLSGLADLIADNEVPVVFQDNQASPQAITSLSEAVRARGWDVEISREELFADSLGPTAPVDTHLGVFAHNARVIAEALAGGAR